MHLALVIGHTRSAFDQTLPMRYQFSKGQSLQVSNVLKCCSLGARRRCEACCRAWAPTARTKAPRQVTHAAIERDWLIIA